jgi:LysM repeat protein
MINNIKCIVLLSFLFITTLASSQSRSQAYLLYIDQYYKLAQKQQKEYGIPASITLAQGLLESSAGQSFLSKSSNNHFGIKCNDWAGEKVYYDDDEKGECFRKYDQVIDSYEDHSAFLKTRKRYSSLFDLDPTDYEGWAFGLKKAGYATDPTYAFKLISIVENYELHNFDLGKKYSETIKNSDTKSSSRGNKDNNYGSMGSVKAYTNHIVMKVNGTRFVTAIEGDTYSIIANEFNMGETRLRKYNEVTSVDKLAAGARVFISAKKDKAPKECLTHQVQDGETMHSIAQDYGIKLAKLYDLNNMSYNEGAVYGRVLKLR